MDDEVERGERGVVRGEGGERRERGGRIGVESMRNHHFPLKPHTNQSCAGSNYSCITLLKEHSP